MTASADIFEEVVEVISTHERTIDVFETVVEVLWQDHVPGGEVFLHSLGTMF